MTGLYVGTAGVAYTFYYLAKCGHFPEKNEEFKQIAMSYLVSALNNYEQRSRYVLKILNKLQ